MKKSHLFHPELSYTLVGICFEAHNEHGNYAREKQYGDFIQKKLDELKIPYKRELVVAGTGNTVDFLVDNKLVLEIKSKRIITKSDYEQVQRYLHATECRLGILVNFRERHIKPKRVVRIDNLKEKGML